MPIPTRPVDGAATATEWGQAVHDRVFTPKGARVAGGASSSVGTSLAQLQLNTAVDDPGGWLASDALTVPVAAGRLYLVTIEAQTDNGSVGERTRIQLRVNGAGVRTFFIDNNGATAETDSRGFLYPLDAGDVLTVYAAKTGGLDPDVLVRALDVIEMGYEIGA